MSALDNDHTWLERICKRRWHEDDLALGTNIVEVCAAMLTQQQPCDFIQRYFARLGAGTLTADHLREFAVMARQAYARWRVNSTDVTAWMRLVGRPGKPTMKDFREYEAFYDR